MDLLRRLRFLSTLIIVLGAVACGTGQTAPGYIGRVEPPESPVLRVAIGEDPRGLDPTRYQDQNSWRVARMLFTGLFSFSAEGRTDPALAARTTVNDNSTRFTFDLRPDAMWSDGTGVTASDFVYAWRRVLDPALGAESAKRLYVIRGARAINEGLADPATLGARAISERVLEVELEHPLPDFPQHAALPPFFPVPSEAVAIDYLDWPRSRAPVCNGPFVLEEWALNDRLVLQRSDSYMDRESVELEGVILYPIADQNTTYNLYRTGSIDWTTASMISEDRARELLREEYSEVRVSTVYATYYLELNTAREPLNDPRVRRALELTVPRDEITGAIMGGGHRPSRVLVTTDLPDWIPPGIEGGDAETARQLLADAGYPGGEGIPRLTYLYVSTGPHGAIAEYLQGVWGEELGITIEPVPMEFLSMEDRASRGDYHIKRSIWLADLPAPVEFLQVFESGNPNNASGWEDPEYDSLLEQARRTGDLDERQRILREAEELLLSDVPIIPLLQYANVQLVKPYVEGLLPNPLDVVAWSGVRMNTEWQPPN